MYMYKVAKWSLHLQRCNLHLLNIVDQADVKKYRTYFKKFNTLFFPHMQVCLSPWMHCIQYLYRRYMLNAIEDTELHPEKQSSPVYHSKTHKKCQSTATTAYTQYLSLIFLQLVFLSIWCKCMYIYRYIYRLRRHQLPSSQFNTRPQVWVFSLKFIHFSFKDWVEDQTFWWLLGQKCKRKLSCCGWGWYGQKLSWPQLNFCNIKLHLYRHVV